MQETTSAIQATEEIERTAKRVRLNLEQGNTHRAGTATRSLLDQVEDLAVVVQTIVDNAAARG